MCLTELEWNFLNDEQHDVCNLYGVPKTYKFKIIESSINT